MALSSSFTFRQAAEWFALFLILILAFALRWMWVDVGTLWGDEAISWMQANNNFRDMLVATAGDNYPPLHNIILWTTIQIFGDSSFALRLPSLILSMGTVVLLYAFGKSLWGSMTGLIAALFLSISIFDIQYAGEARMYALLAFTSVLFAFSMLLALRKPTRLNIFAIAIAAIILLFTHVYGIFVFAAINGFVLISLWRKNTEFKLQFWDWFLSQVLAGLVFLPWMVMLVGRVKSGHGTISWIPYPDADYIWGTFKDILGGYFHLLILFYLMTFVLLVPYCKSQVVGYSGVKVFDWKVMFCLTWLGGPIFIGLLLSVLVTPIMFNRYLICIVPVALLLAARGITVLFSSHMAQVIASLGAAFLVFPMQHELVRADWWRSDHAVNFKQFEKLRRPTDTIYANSLDKYVVQYYVRNVKAETVLQLENDLKGVALPQRFWVLNLGEMETYSAIRAKIREAGFKETYHAESVTQLFSLFEK